MNKTKVKKVRTISVRDYLGAWQTIEHDYTKDDKCPICLATLWVSPNGMKYCNGLHTVIRGKRI